MSRRLLLELRALRVVRLPRQDNVVAPRVQRDDRVDRLVDDEQVRGERDRGVSLKEVVARGARRAGLRRLRLPAERDLGPKLIEKRAPTKTKTPHHLAERVGPLLHNKAGGQLRLTDYTPELVEQSLIRQSENASEDRQRDLRDVQELFACVKVDSEFK